MENYESAFTPSLKFPFFLASVFTEGYQSVFFKLASVQIIELAGGSGAVASRAIAYHLSVGQKWPSPVDSD